MKRRTKDSLAYSFAIVTGLGTVLSLFGISLVDIFSFKNESFCIASVYRLLIVLPIYGAITLVVSELLKYKIKQGLNISVGGNSVTIKRADIFKENALRVIPVETHFQTTVDDIIISENSLHGKLVQQHADPETLKQAIKKEAKRLGISQGKDKLYSFDLGTAIRCDGKDGEYIMVALIALDENYEAHTNTRLFMDTLSQIWKEINRVYNGHDIALPIFGSGITRFDDEHYSIEEKLICMLQMLKKSKVHFRSNISILLFSEEADKILLSLHDNKELFNYLR